LETLHYTTFNILLSVRHYKLFYKFWGKKEINPLKKKKKKIKLNLFSSFSLLLVWPTSISSSLNTVNSAFEATGCTAVKTTTIIHVFDIKKIGIGRHRHDLPVHGYLV
jgi:hypothetical protein